MLPTNLAPADNNHPLNQKLYPRIVFFSMTVVFLIIHFYVVRRMMNLYETFDVAPPVTARYAGLIAAAISFSAGLFSFRKDESYPQPNEQQNAHQTVIVHEALVMIVLGILVAFVVYSIVSPIYSLTSQFQP